MRQASYPDSVGRRLVWQAVRMPGGGDRRTTGRLVIITGLPGSGKTTLASTLAGSMPACRMCPDEWMAASRIDPWDSSARSRIEAFQLELTLELLPAGKHVVIEWGVWTCHERDALRDAGRSIEAGVEFRYLTADIEELWRRIAARVAGQHSASRLIQQHELRPIQRQDLEEWIRVYEPPTNDEIATYDKYDGPPP